MEKIKIEMTPLEIDSLIAFRKHQSTFEVLHNAGVFDVRNGKVTMNFDASGGLEEIKLDIVRFKRGKPMLVIHT